MNSRSINMVCSKFVYGRVSVCVEVRRRQPLVSVVSSHPPPERNVLTTPFTRLSSSLSFSLNGYLLSRIRETRSNRCC